VVGCQRFRGPCCFCMDLRIAGILPQQYTASQPRKPPCTGYFFR